MWLARDPSTSWSTSQDGDPRTLQLNRTKRDPGISTTSGLPKFARIHVVVLLGTKELLCRIGFHETLRNQLWNWYNGTM